MTEYILISLLILAIIVGIATIILIYKIKNKRPTKDIDYRAFYILGISFLPLGIILPIVTENPGMISFLGLGIVYIAIGLSNQDKWKSKM